MENFIELKIEDLKILKHKFNDDYPLHISTISTLETFIERFQKYPEWAQKVKFFSLQDDWNICGSFIMVIGGKRVYFNTLEDFPQPKLKLALITMDFEDKITFINIRDGLRHLLLDCLRYQHFEIVSDIGTRSILFTKEFLKQIDLKVPEGFILAPLRKEHVDKINDAWKGKCDGSRELIENAIELNTSMGAYHKADGALVAWNMRFDTGAMSVGGIDNRFKGQVLGRYAILGLAKEICNQFDTDVFFEIVHGNELAVALSKGFTIIDTQSWVSALRKKYLDKFPIWGHL